MSMAMTHASLLCLPCLVATLFGAACASPERPSSQQGTAAPFDLVAMRKVIEAKNARFTRAHVDGDVATIDAMFTRGATSLPPGAEAVVGIAAIHALTMEYLTAGVKEFREETTDFYGNADMLIDQGTYVMTYGPDDVVERGKYLNVWRQEDGDWKLHANIWNTSPPAAAK